MSYLKQSDKCYETIEKLTAKYLGYTYFLALAAIELKDFEKAESLLDQCQRSSKITDLVRAPILIPTSLKMESICVYF